MTDLWIKLRSCQIREIESIRNNSTERPKDRTTERNLINGNMEDHMPLNNVRVRGTYKILEIKN